MRLSQRLSLYVRRRSILASSLVFVLPWSQTVQCRESVDSEPLEEVMVTARKVPEAISRVPMSVQSLSGEFLERRDLSTLYELQYEVPGLVVNNRGMFGAGISLRGVADEGGASLAVAPHLNGVYLGRSSLALARQFDLERVEVVKGPQGTLYGRNATGGSINVITRVPTPELGASLEAALGSFDTKRIRGHINLPAGKLSARIALAGSEGDGFIRNVVDNRRFAEEDYLAARVSLRAQPAGSLTIDAMLQHVEDDGASGELWSPRPDQLPDPRDIRLTRVTLANPYMTTANDFASVNVSWDLDALTLRSISGYARSVTRSLDDCAGIDALAGCVRGVRPLRYEQRSQELRLESMAGDKFDWLVGLYYAEGFEAQNFLQSVPGIAPVPLNDSTSTSDETAYALFGDGSYALTPRWKLSGGLRFSRDRQRLTDVGSGLSDNKTLVAAAGAWDATSWRLGVEFAPRDSIFIYGSVSTGFRSGGVTAMLLPNREFDFDPEKLLAYEAGVSARLAGGRTALRASAFAYEIEDMQVRTTTILANRVATVTDNAAAARISGIEFSANTRIGNPLTLTGALIWLPRREFVEFTDTMGNLLSDNKISRASEWSSSISLDYRVAFRGLGDISAAVDYNYRSKFFFTKENDPIASQNDFGLLNLGLRFDSIPHRWYVFASARNVLDTDYFTQILFQSAPGYPANYEVGFGWRY